MIYHSIKEYLEAKCEWEQTPVTINKKGMFINGERVVPDISDKPSYEVMPKQNPDGTVINLGVMPTKQQR